MNRRTLLVSSLGVALPGILTEVGFADIPSIRYFERQGERGKGGRKWALLVGVSRYEDVNITSLDFTVADVKAVGKALKESLEFDYVGIMPSDAPRADESYPSSANILKRLEGLTKQVQPGDTFLFYFSGHGFQDQGGQNFLGSVDADVGSQTRLKKTTLSTDDLKEALSGLRASQVVFVMDACRRNPFKDKAGGDNLRSESFTKDLVRVAASTGGGKPATALIFACEEGKKAYEWGAKGQGAFTYYLLEGLRGKAARGGTLTVDDLAAYVARGLQTYSLESGNEQRPEFQQVNGAGLVLGRYGTKPNPRPVATHDPRTIIATLSDRKDVHPVTRYEMAVMIARELFHAEIGLETGQRSAVCRETPADIPQNHWARGSVNYLIEKRIFQGDVDGLYRGAHTFKRYEAAVILARCADALFPGIQPGPIPYADVSPEHWACQAVRILSAQGILPVVTDGFFQGNRILTFGELRPMVAAFQAKQREK